jgi:hypothetical protein
MTAVVIGFIAILVTPAVAWSVTQMASGTVTVRTGHSGGRTVVAAASPSSAARLGAVPAAAVPAAAPGAPVATAGAGVAGGAVSGQAAVASTDLSVESVSAPSVILTWIVVVLVLLVIAGAAKAYGRSPQRAAIRDCRTRS